MYGRIFSLFAALVLSVTSLVACDDPDEAASRPADLVPADAIFVATLDLAEDRREELDALLASTTLESVDNTIAGFVTYFALDRSLRCDFESDLQPLLSGSASGFASLSDGAVQGDAGIILDVEQPQRALAAAARCADAGPEEHSYAEHSFRLKGDLALGEVDGHIVFGTETAFKQVVDVVQGESSLTQSEGFADAFADQAGDPTLLLYLDTDLFPQFSFLPGLDEVEGPLTIAAYANDDTLAVETSFRTSLSGPLGEALASALAPGLLHDLPVTTFLGVGLGDLGNTVPDVLAFFEKLDAPPTTGDRFARDFHDRFGLKLSEVLEWAGPGAIGVVGENSVSAVATTFLVEAEDSVAMERAVRSARKWVKSRSSLIENRILGNVYGFWVYTLGGDIYDVRLASNLLSITLLGVGDVGQSAIGGGDLNQTDEYLLAEEALGDVPVQFFFDATQYKDLYAVTTPSPTGFGAEDFLGAITYAAAGGRIEDGDVLLRLVAGFGPERDDA